MQAALIDPSKVTKGRHLIRVSVAARSGNVGWTTVRCILRA